MKYMYGTCSFAIEVAMRHRLTIAPADSQPMTMLLLMVIAESFLLHCLSLFRVYIIHGCTAHIKKLINFAYNWLRWRDSPGGRGL